MKKLLLALLAIPSLAFCDTKISNLTPATTMAQTDIVPIVINPGTTPANRIITLQNLSGSIVSTITATSLGALTTSSATATYLNVLQGLTQSSATATYLQNSSATVTYAPITGSNNYIQNTSTLQSGATFYVSSGTVAGTFATTGNTTIGSIAAQVFIPNIGNGSSGQRFVTISPTISGNPIVSSTITAADVPLGSGYYVQNTSALQSGATFYVSSGTIAGSLNVNNDVVYDPTTFTLQVGTTTTGTIMSNAGLRVWARDGSTPSTIKTANPFATTYIPFSSFIGDGSSLSFPNGATFQVRHSTNGEVAFTNIYGTSSQGAYSFKGLSGSANYFSMDASSQGAKGPFYVQNLNAGECVQTTTGGQLTTTGSACGSGGGGSSSLQVTQSGVQITSPTTSMNFLTNQFSLAAVGSTSTISLNSSSVTLQGNNLGATYLTNSSATTTYLQISSASATYCYANGTNCTTTAAGSGIVSPGTFTWTNTGFGVAVSTLVAGSATSTSYGNNSYVTINSSGTSQNLTLNINGQPSGGVQNKVGGLTINALGPGGPPIDMLVLYSSYTSAQGGSAMLSLWQDNPLRNDPMIWLHRVNADSSPEMRWDGPSPNMEMVMNSGLNNAIGEGKWEPFAIATGSRHMQCGSNRANNNGTFENLCELYPLYSATEMPGVYYHAQNVSDDVGILSSSDTSSANFFTLNAHTVGITAPQNPSASYVFGLPDTVGAAGNILYNNGNRGGNFNVRQWKWTGTDLAYSASTGVTISTLTFNTPALQSQNCLGTDATGKVQAGTCTGGSGITALTGDVTASGTGSAVATAAALQPNITTFSSSITVTNASGEKVTYGIAVGSMTASSATVAGQMTAGTYQGGNLSTCGDGSHALSWSAGSFGCQAISAGVGDMVLASTQTSTGAKTFLSGDNSGVGTVIVTSSGTSNAVKITANGTYGTSNGTSGGLLLDCTGGGQASGMCSQIYSNAGAQTALDALQYIRADNTAWNEPLLYLSNASSSPQSTIRIDSGWPTVSLVDASIATGNSGKKFQQSTHLGVFRLAEGRNTADSAFDSAILVSSMSSYGDVAIGQGYNSATDTQLQIISSTNNVNTLSLSTASVGGFKISFTTNAAITGIHSITWPDGTVQVSSPSAGGGGGITALTGDVTASGTGSVVATAAALQPNITTFSSSVTVTNASGAKVNYGLTVGSLTVTNSSTLTSIYYSTATDSKNASYTMTAADHIIFASSTLTQISTITLPAANAVAPNAQRIMIYKVDMSTTPVIILPTPGDTIVGISTVELYSYGVAQELISDGDHTWFPWGKIAHPPAFMGNNQDVASASALVANTMYLQAWNLEEPCDTSKVAFKIGTASGNTAVAIYDQWGNIVVSSGPFIANAAINISSDVPHVHLAPGLYYLGFGFDNATATVTRYASNLISPGVNAGMYAVANGISSGKPITSLGNPPVFTNGSVRSPAVVWSCFNSP